MPLLTRMCRMTVRATVVATLAMLASLGTAAADDLRPATTKQTYGVSERAVAAARSYRPEDEFTATWQRADALKVASDATNTTPRIPESFPTIEPSVWQWDTWPLTGLDTKPLKYQGWHVIFSLVAQRSKVGYGDRHWAARIGYYYSRDGHAWKYGGQLMPEGWGIGCMEWAGSTVHTGGSTIKAVYTTVGEQRGPACPTAPPYDTTQRLATSTGQIHADSRGVWFTGFRSHTVVAEPDGRWYQTETQGTPPYDYAFRDPFVFRDPKDGKVYATFEGNSGGVAGTHECTARDLGHLPRGHVVPDEARNFTGNIGLMRATNAALTRWELLPPLLSANCVNRQTERPHLVIKNDRYYLFTISHAFTYAPGLTGPDGVYGFVGPSLRSAYKPLNGSALVLGNPPDAPEQNYSHNVLPNGMVQSFIDQVPRAGGGTIPGGTLAPTLQLDLRGSNTYLTRVLPYGYLPALASVR